MRSCRVVVFGVFPDQVFKVILAECGEVVEAFSFDGAHPGFGVGIEIRGFVGNHFDLDSAGLDDFVELFGEFGVAVAEQEFFPFPEDSPLKNSSVLAVSDIQSLFGCFVIPAT